MKLYNVRYTEKVLFEAKVYAEHPGEAAEKAKMGQCLRVEQIRFVEDDIAIRSIKVELEQDENGYYHPIKRKPGN